jgi:hypothetical protein
MFHEKPNLVKFDPNTMAELETEMWRSYYDRNYLKLAKGLYQSSRHVGFSPLTCVSIMFKAARAAFVFQKSRSRARANAALPALASYFSAISVAAPSRFDPEQVAKAELDWWQGRREKMTPERYGRLIARVTGAVYGVHERDVVEACVLRASAMAYRDARRGAVSNDDWSEIRRRLVDAYSSLRKVVDARYGSRQV